MNGRSKGKGGEREAARLCAGWWSAIEPGVQFVSTPQSGGWATPKLRGAFKAAGDLMTTSVRWPFSVEVKRREGWSWATLLARKQSPVWGWWDQCLKAAGEEGRVPLLLLRHNSPSSHAQEPWHIGLPPSFGLTGRPQVVIAEIGLAIYRWHDLEREGPERAIALAGALCGQQLATAGA